MFTNFDYLQRDINTFKRDAPPRLEKIAACSKEFLNMLPKIKEVFQKYEGKAPSKRIDTALKSINKNLCFSHQYAGIKYLDSWELKLFHDYDVSFTAIYNLSIETVNCSKIFEELDRAAGWAQNNIDKITSDIKNIDEIAANICRAVNDFNKTLDSLSGYTADVIGLKLKHIY